MGKNNLKFFEYLILLKYLNVFLLTTAFYYITIRLLVLINSFSFYYPHKIGQSGSKGKLPLCLALCFLTVAMGRILVYNILIDKKELNR